ncbi:hypothetical protein ACOMHN_045583 [Nucella lapillus]
MPATALVLLAEGAEEMETVITVDVLRRGGVEVTLAGLTGKGAVKCSRNVHIVPDESLEKVQGKEFDALILPGGGGGANKLAECKKVGELLKKQMERGALVAAICAAPKALAAHGIAKGKKVTSYPSFEKEMHDYTYLQDPVVQDGNLITSRGPGTCFEFALKIVEYLVNQDKAKSLVEPMLLKM